MAFTRTAKLSGMSIWSRNRRMEVRMIERATMDLPQARERGTAWSRDPRWSGRVNLGEFSISCA